MKNIFLILMIIGLGFGFTACESKEKKPKFTDYSNYQFESNKNKEIEND